MSTVLTEEPEVGTVAYEDARLDRLMPGWHEKVNTDILDMIHCDHCVLGQVYGSFDDGYDLVADDRIALNQVNLHTVGLYSNNVYAEAWTEEINRRKM